MVNHYDDNNDNNYGVDVGENGNKSIMDNYLVETVDTMRTKREREQNYHVTGKLHNCITSNKEIQYDKLTPSISSSFVRHTRLEYCIWIQLQYIFIKWVK